MTDPAPAAIQDQPRLGVSRVPVREPLRAKARAAVGRRRERSLG